MNKICVYTCITGDYDNLIDIQNIEQGIDYICYTNNKKIKSKIWKVKHIVDNTLTDAELNRKIKILGTEELKKYDVTIYIDGNFTIVGSIKKLIEENVDLKKYDFVGFKHSVRNSINEEMLACLMYNKENIENISKLYDFYNREKFPDNNGLIEASILIRNFNNDKLNECMKLWFDMYINYAHRDQLCFQYAAWKTGLKYDLLDMSVWDNEYTKNVEHIVSKQINVDVYFKLDGKFLVDKSKNISFEVGENQFVGNIIADFEYDEIVLKFNTECDLVLYDEKYNEYEVRYVNCIQSQGKVLFNSKPVVIIKVNNKRDFIIHLTGYLDKSKNTYLECYRKEIHLNSEVIKEKENFIKKLTDAQKKLKKQNNALIQKNNELADENADLLLENKKINKEYSDVINSKRWKVTSKLFSITNIFKRK